MGGFDLGGFDVGGFDLGCLDLGGFDVGGFKLGSRRLERFGSMSGSPTRSIRVVTLICALLTAAVCVATPFGGVAWWALPVLAAGVALSEVGVVYLQFDRQR